MVTKMVIGVHKELQLDNKHDSTTLLGYLCFSILHSINVQYWSSIIIYITVYMGIYDIGQCINVLLSLTLEV